MRELFALRGNSESRQAQRTARQEAVERELRQKFGVLDADLPTPASSSTTPATRAAASGEEARFASAAVAAGGGAPRCVAPGGGGGRSSPEQEEERDVRRPRMAAAGGPPRPPKPKPHRPAVLVEESPGSGGCGGVDAACGALPSEKRWRSALLPVWPDRQTASAEEGGVSEVGASMPACALDLSMTAPSCIFVCGPPPSQTITAQDASPAAPPEPRAVAPDLPVGAPEPESHQGSVQDPTGSGGGTVGAVGDDARLGKCVSGDLADSEVSTSAGASPMRVASVCGDIAGSHVRPATANAGTPSASVRGAKRVANLDSGGLAATLQPRAEDLLLAEKSRQLEESAKRLREHSERVRTENRRSRLFGNMSQPGREGSAVDSHAPAEQKEADASDEQVAWPSSGNEKRRFDDMRRKIAELDAINDMERQRLEDEQLAVAERQRQQEEFEKRVQDQTERELRELRERGAREEKERAQREEKERRDFEDRTRRRKEQQDEEQDRSRQLEEKRREGRSEKEQLKWQSFEEELERQWSEQEVEDKRRVEAYARERRRQYDEWDRKLTAERQRLGASDAEFRNAARVHKVRSAAHADESFYGPQRGGNGGGANGGAKPRHPPGPPSGPRPTPPPNQGGSAGRAGAAPGLPAGPQGGRAQALNPEEQGILKELQSVRAASRDVQKAKVKDLLFRWHPDKNPSCQEKATCLFQFVQKQRELVLGL